MITPLTLQESLNVFLKNEVADRYLLKTVTREGKESLKNPQIVSGWILPEGIDDEDGDAEEFPYIITRIAKVENIKGARESVVTVLILFGAYCPGTYDDNEKLVPDDSGYRDIWNLIESTRQALFRQMTIDNKYRIADDFFEAEMSDEQVYPYWEGFIKTKWHVVFPNPQPDPGMY